MAIKTVLAPIVSLPEDEAAFAACEQLAVQFSAHAVALAVAVHLGSPLAEREAALSDVLTDMVRGQESHAGRERVELAERAAHARVQFELRDVVADEAIHQRAVLAHAHCVDLVTLARADTRLHRRLLETLLFGSGRPVLLVPQNWRPSPFSRVMIAWDAKRAAVRATNDAIDLLIAAQQVAIVTVDAEPSPSGHGQAPGCELAMQLARHGAHAEVRNIDSMGRSAGRALLDEAAACGADLVVMGGYGHTKAQEMVFGGVTRELTSHAPLPLLLSH